MAPSSYNPMDALGRPGGAGTMVSAPASGVRETSNTLTDFVPESRKLKVEEVDSSRHHQQQQQDDRVRLGLHFSHEGSGISPNAYRTYSDFPRTSYPPQMPAPATAGQLSQSDFVNEENPSTTVRTAVSLPTLEQFKDCEAPFSVSRARDRCLEGHDHRRFCDEEVHKRWWMNPSQPSGKLNFSEFGMTIGY